MEGSLTFPLIVKPHFTHVYERRSGQKFERVDDFDHLLRAYEALSAAAIPTLLVEWIPGPDDRLCSYYTYLDGEGTPHFHFTKRIIRRFPVGMGNACYHVTDWNPEVRDLALKLFRWVGLRGLANAEFKRDERDGLLKLIECNARFTAANCLVARSGFDLAAFVYNRIVGRPQPPLETYTPGLRLWDPVRDFAVLPRTQEAGATHVPAVGRQHPAPTDVPVLPMVRPDAVPGPGIEAPEGPLGPPGAVVGRSTFSMGCHNSSVGVSPMPNILIMPTPLRHRPGRYRELLGEAGFTPTRPARDRQVERGRLARGPAGVRCPARLGRRSRPR